MPISFDAFQIRLESEFECEFLTNVRAGGPGHHSVTFQVKGPSGALAGGAVDLDETDHLPDGEVTKVCGLLGIDPANFIP